MNMDISKMVFGGAILGTLASCWGSIKSIGWKICTILIKKIDIEQQLIPPLFIYLKENYKYICLHDKSFFANDTYIKDCRKYQKTAWEDFSNSNIIFFNNKIPFYFNRHNNTTKDKDGNTSQITGCKIYYIRGTIDIYNIINCSIERINKIIKDKIEIENENNNRFFIKYIPGIKKDSKFEINYDFTYTTNHCLTHKLNDLGLYVNREGIDKIVLTKANKEVIKLANLWKSNKKWYQERDIPWKMGWLLHGPPGSGKTLLSRRIAEHLNMPLFVYKLGMLSDPEFSEEWTKMQSSTPCVALIEDFDNVFHGRTNVTSIDSFMDRLHLLEDKPKENDEDKLRTSFGRKVSFDNLLNTLDGAERYEGVLTIITTNHIDKIDPAILDRPGRIDKVIELTYLTEENKLALIDKLLYDMPGVRQEAINYIKSHTEHMTPAQLQEKCTELALKELYKC